MTDTAKKEKIID